MNGSPIMDISQRRKRERYPDDGKKKKGVKSSGEQLEVVEKTSFPCS